MELKPEPAQVSWLHREYVMRFVIITMLLLVASVAQAKNIDLSTVPVRDTVQLTIYNAEDLTLVRETRKLVFKKGVNPLQFSWAGTLIDPSSVELRFLTSPDELTVLDTMFPHDKPQMLYWNIQSDFDGEATVEISYFTSGITWSADYVGIATPDEKTMKLEGFVTVTNNSGEDYEDASVRLVVGTINLVEQIAMLAQQGMGGRGGGQGLFGDDEGVTRTRAMRRAVGKAELAFDAVSASMAPMEEKQIVKEGLSEYFIFAIEGTETVPDGWSKRMRSFEAPEAPIKIEYRYRLQEYGDQLVRMYLLTNDEKSDLGESPLPDGMVRVFKQKDAGLGYVTEQPVKYIPIGDKIELNLGVDPNVIFELRTLRTFRDNIWGTFGANVRRRMDGAGLRIEDRGVVEGWDEHYILEQVVRNYTPGSISLEIRRIVGGDATFTSDLGAKNHDFQTVEYRVDIDAGETIRPRYELTIKQGTNAKQNRVEVVAGVPSEVSWAD